MRQKTVGCGRERRPFGKAPSATLVKEAEVTVQREKRLSRGALLPEDLSSRPECVSKSCGTAGRSRGVGCSGAVEETLPAYGKFYETRGETQRAARRQPYHADRKAPKKKVEKKAQNAL